MIDKKTQNLTYSVCNNDLNKNENKNNNLMN